MNKVVVGSGNPVKIEAVRLGFSRVWPAGEWLVSGVDVLSGVGDQPMTDEESIRGARNRVNAVLEQVSDTDYAVGIEGGLQKIGDDWFNCGWVVVKNKDNEEGIGSSARIMMPPSMMELIDQGYELGEVCDKLFETENVKQGEGHFGLMTDGAITRTSGYVDAVVMALSRFVRRELFA